MTRETSVGWSNRLARRILPRWGTAPGRRLAGRGEVEEGVVRWRGEGERSRPGGPRLEWGEGELGGDA